MATLNKVELIGNLGADPEVRYFPDGTAVANASLATTDTWKDKDSGEKKSKTEWHRLVFYRGLAEIAKEYLKKGAQVYVDGKLRTRVWKDKEGVERMITEILVQNLQMLGKKAAEDYPVPAAPTGDDIPYDTEDGIPF